MNTSSTREGSTGVDKPTAWACALTNAAALPGLGTIAGGRKIGYVQAACALVGFGLSLGGLVAHLRIWYQTGEMPRTFTVGLLVAAAGMLLFAMAWLWALASSVRLHREATKVPPPPQADGVARSALPPRL